MTYARKATTISCIRVLYTYIRWKADYFRNDRRMVLIIESIWCSCYEFCYYCVCKKSWMDVLACRDDSSCHMEQSVYRLGSIIVECRKPFWFSSHKQSQNYMHTWLRMFWRTRCAEMRQFRRPSNDLERYGDVWNCLINATSHRPLLADKR